MFTVIYTHTLFFYICPPHTHAFTHRKKDFKHNSRLSSQKRKRRRVVCEEGDRTWKKKVLRHPTLSSSSWCWEWHSWSGIPCRDVERGYGEKERWSLQISISTIFVCLPFWLLCHWLILESSAGQSLQIDVPESHSGSSICQHQSILTGSIFYLHHAPLYQSPFLSPFSPSFCMIDWLIDSVHSCILLLDRSIDGPFSVSLSLRGCLVAYFCQSSSSIHCHACRMFTITPQTVSIMKEKKLSV